MPIYAAIPAVHPKSRALESDETLFRATNSGTSAIHAMTPKPNLGNDKKNRMPHKSAKKKSRVCGVPPVQSGLMLLPLVFMARLRIF